MKLSATDYAIHLTISGVLIVGIYQFYFWCQHHYLGRPRSLKLPVDDWIPYWPSWVWVYSFLYYPIVLYINAVIESPRHFLHVVMSFVVLLAMQMVFFLLFPVATPDEWRARNQRRNLSERFLAFVHRFDAASNCFPSMHVAVAMLTALHLQPHLGAWAFAFPVLISISCLFTKAHYIVDLPVGALFGAVAFWMFKFVYA